MLHKLFVFVSLLAPSVAADVELPALFSDGMVLQREMDIPVWGRARVGEHITVRLGEESQQTIADRSGCWSIVLAPLPAGGPHVLDVRGENQIRIKDVLVGEVWLGSGQSNMVMEVNDCLGYQEEAARCNGLQVRVFREGSGPSSEPNWKGKGSWVRTSPRTVGDFSAVLFYFGRRVHEELGVPVGLIDSSVGGTPIQSWTRREAQFQCEALAKFVREENLSYKRIDPKRKQEGFERRLAIWRKEAERAQAAGLPPPGNPPKNKVELWMRQGGVGGLYNGKIAPLVPYAIRGVAWYQGEANTRRVWAHNTQVHQALLYQAHLELLVRDWRAQWNRDDLPFVWVQLPGFNDGRDDTDWPTVREGMRRALALPNTGMVIAIDQGESNDIHPPEKREISRRLAMWALGEVYGHKGATSGPLYSSHVLRGSTMIVRFTHVNRGLKEPEGGVLEGFELAAADGSWHSAQARIERNTVVVTAASLRQPVAVRYAWANDPDVSLFDGMGLPASPFTTGSLDSSLKR
jgi:sialate O-acetylesterase